MPLVSDACGPYYTEIPKPDFLTFDVQPEAKADDIQRNIELWKQETNVAIPDSDVIAAVYKMSLKRFDALSKEQPDSSTNKFIAFVVKNQRHDIIDFLSLAKDVEEQRRDYDSPWYYPADSIHPYPGLDSLINECRKHAKSKFADRYGLQLMRSVYASGRYEDVKTEFENWYSDVADTNLFKQMSMSYVAGALLRLDRESEADIYVARSGVVNNAHTFQLVSAINPSELNLIGYFEESEERMLEILPTVTKMLNEKATMIENVGCWYMAAAFTEAEYAKNDGVARKWVRRGISDNRTSAEMRAILTVYGMLLDGRQGRTDNITSNLMWFAKQMVQSPEYDMPIDDYSCGYRIYRYPSNRWNTTMRYLACEYWIPNLMKKGDKTQAIRVAACFDYMSPAIHGNQYIADFDWDSNSYTPRPVFGSLTQMHSDLDCINTIDYSSYVFSLMYSQRPEDIIKYKTQLGYSPLDRFSRHDDDYLNELIGTMLLRDKRYIEAEQYLSRVSPLYQNTLNVYKCGYLSRNPYSDMITLSNDPYRQSVRVKWKKFVDPTDAKLRFARHMIGLEKSMRNSDQNIVAFARLQYAELYYRSLDYCWALTQYSKGDIYGYYSEYSTEANPKLIAEAESEYEKIQSQAISQMSDPEWKAWTLHYLGYNASVAERYPHTAMASYLRTNCDSYEDWLGWKVCSK